MSKAGYEADPDIPTPLAHDLNDFMDAAKMIAAATECYQRGDEIIRDLRSGEAIGPIVLPENLRFILTSAPAELTIEVWERRRFLDPKAWVPARDEEIALRLSRMRNHPHKLALIGNVTEIDYLTNDALPRMWVYDVRKLTRAAFCRGVSLAVRSLTYVEARYTKANF